MRPKAGARAVGGMAIAVDLVTEPLVRGGEMQMRFTKQSELDCQKDREHKVPGVAKDPEA